MLLKLSSVALWLTVIEAPRVLFGQPVREVPEPSPAELEARAAAFETMLDERGWVQHGDEVRPGDGFGGFAQPEIEPQWAFPPHRATLYLNFLGAAMSPGTNADLDQSPCVNQQMEWPGFQGNEQQALALIEIFEHNMAPYGVRIAYRERPPSHLPYSMVMMGGTAGMLGLPAGVLGVSCSSDCGDRWWRDTTFAFTDAINPNNAPTLGTTALHEAAHAFGLAHINDSSRIMHPFVGGANVTWAQQCTAFNDATGGINCRNVHAEFCDGTEAQNTHAELLAYFGPNGPDVEPPVVTITQPSDGIRIEPGEPLTLEVDVTDDHDGVGWKLVIPEGDFESVAYTFQKRWELAGFPEGIYTLRVEAIDHDLNEGFDEVTVFVGMDPVELPDDDDDNDNDNDNDNDTDDVASGTDTDASGPSGEGEELRGCACAASTPTSPTILSGWLLLIGIGATRRRRA